MTVSYGSFTLFDYQETDYNRILDEGHKSAFIAYEQALGKTALATALSIAWGVKTILIVAPKNTRRSWKNTIKAMNPDADFYQLETAKKHVSAFGFLKMQKPGYYFIGWELMRTGAITGQSADLIIADEVHRAQNYGNSDTAKLFVKLEAEYKLALSGTPSANRPQGLFAPIHWLWTKRYKSFYADFLDKFWLTRRNGSVIDLIREREPNMIVNDLPCFIRRLKKDHRKDLPPVLPPIIIETPLTAKQRKLYKQFEETALAWLGDHPVAASIPLVQRLRMFQITVAEPSVNEDGELTFALDAKSSKIKALIEICEANPEEPIFVTTPTAAAIPAIIAQLAKAGIKAEGFDGTVKQDRRDELVETLGDDYRVLVAGTAAVAEGLDGLQYKCSIGVEMAKHGSWMINKQARERLDRPGQKNPVQWYELHAPDTLDEDIDERQGEINETMRLMYDNTDEEKA